MAGTGASGGRNAKSRASHVLAGTFRADRHGDHETPEAPKGRPEPPKPLEGDALVEWDAMTADLEACGTLARTDRMALYQYCRLFAETEALVVKQGEAAATVGILEDNLSGIPKDQLRDVFQEITKMRQLEAGYDTKIRQGRMALRQFLVEFGMTPAARSRVKLPASKPKSKLEQFMGAKVV